MEQQKYAVFKFEDFSRLVQLLEARGEPNIAKDFVGAQINGCMVLRHQDVFAPAAFRAYASGVQLVLDTAVIGGRRTELMALRDRFEASAVIASTHPHKKFPD